MTKIDLTGQKFGRLTVIEESPIKKNKKRCWICQCDCGNQVTVRQSSLTSGNTKSCGCLNKEIIHKKQGINLVGQKFGRLTVIKENPIRKDGKIQWDCICDCGNTTTVKGSNLRKGTTKSCGCLQQEVRSKIHTRNLIGQRFGKLTVIEKDNSKPIGNIYWVCKCDCGNIKSIRGNHLTSGDTASCGCLNSSHGEYKIEQLLKENNISFEREKIFNNCKFTNTNYPAKFDFYISDKNYLIEFDGKQHFEERGTWAEKEGLDIIRQRDQFKNNWCKENNIPLIRIPYTHEKDLCIEDLLLETSNFIYKGEQYYEK